jgi:putative oxidoreductase
MNIIQSINRSKVITEDRAKLLLRGTVGFLILLHGIYKLMNPEAVGYIGGMFASIGLPAFLAYLIYIGEIVAPIMLIIGYQTKIAALLVAITMLVAILLAHASQIFTLAEMGGGAAIELQLMYLFGALAIFGLGAGKHRLVK